MRLVANCHCGAEHTVTSSDAGAELMCRQCGLSFDVPRLSQLRRAAGEEAYGLNVAEKIRRLASSKQLPLSDGCVNCAESTTDVLPCVIECERTHTSSSKLMLMLVLAAGLCLVPLPFFWAFSTRHPRVHGRELVLHVPLPVCLNCLSKISACANSQLKKLVGATPPYDELIQAYPKAVVALQDE